MYAQTLLLGVGPDHEVHDVLGVIESRRNRVHPLDDPGVGKFLGGKVFEDFRRSAAKGIVGRLGFGFVGRRPPGIDLGRDFTVFGIPADQAVHKIEENLRHCVGGSVVASL
jgi:hypothetical protein